MVPALVISIYMTQTKAKGDQLTLPRQMLNARNIKEQMQK